MSKYRGIENYSNSSYMYLICTQHTKKKKNMCRSAIGCPNVILLILCLKLWKKKALLRDHKRKVRVHKFFISNSWEYFKLLAHSWCIFTKTCQGADKLQNGRAGKWTKKSKSRIPRKYFQNWWHREILIYGNKILL